MNLLLILQMTSGQPDASNSSFIFFGCVLFAIALFVYIFSPSRVETSVEKSRLSFLYERKDQIYENLRDLNFEYKAGKLSDADFNSMRDSMEQEAAAMLAEIDRLEKLQNGLNPLRGSQNKGARA